MMFYAQSTVKGHNISAKQNVFLPKVTCLIHYLIHIPLDLSVTRQTTAIHDALGYGDQYIKWHDLSV